VITLPAPIVAGRFTLLWKNKGIVGGVLHARAVWLCPTPSAVSSGITVTGVVGVIPCACASPIPIRLAVAAAIVRVISRILVLFAEGARNSRAATPDVPLLVLFEIE
jgi:hypothetical protein